MNKPLASIVCITYNHGPYIETALKSFLAQKTDFEFEVLVSDDCSTDNTANLISGITDLHPNQVYPCLNNNNVGMMNNFLSTLNRARGEFIAICDGDDYWIDQGKLQKQVDILCQYPEIGLVHTDVDLLIDHGDNNQCVGKSTEKQTHLPPKDNQFHALLQHNPIRSCTAVFRKSLFKTHVDTEKMQCVNIGDWFIWLEISKHARIHYIDDKTSVYRILAESTSRSEDPERKLHYWLGAKEIRDYYAKKYTAPPKVIKRIELIHHNAQLQLSWQAGQRSRFDESYRQLSALKQVNLKHIFLWLTNKNPLIYNAARKSFQAWRNLKRR